MKSAPVTPKGNVLSSSPRPPARRGSTLLKRVLWTRKSSGLGALIVAVIVTTAIFAPVFAPADPLRINLRERGMPPSEQHILGTDTLGRDLLSRIIYGARFSLTVSVVSVSIAMVIGGTIGIASGYFGGRLDQVLNAIVEMIMAFPLLLLALVIISVLGPGEVNVMLAIGLSSVPLFARVVRAEANSVRQREYVAAARAVGCSTARIIVKHVLPNLMSSLIVLATMRVATAILTEASLSFLGVGIRPPTPAWGVMVAEGRAHLERAPWIALTPGLAIMITVLAFNLLGDGLRDALDVKRRT